MKKEEMETEEKYDLAKWMAGEMDPDELRAFRNSPEFEHYERIAHASRELRTEDFDADAMLAGVMSRKRKNAAPKVVRFPTSRMFRVAAVVVIALGLLFIFKPNAMVTERAAAGTMASAVLPDGSRVELNSGSEIAYSKSEWGESRKLTLKGEAYFKVAKGKKFDVLTDLGTVTVVGTQFNVKARGKRFEVECYEGKVKVIVNGSVSLLTRGMMAIFDDGRPQGVPVPENTEPAWIKGEIQFTSASLEQVVSELQRRFDVKIELRSDSNKTVTGRFSATNLQETVESLCSLYKLNARTDNNVVILYADE